MQASDSAILKRNMEAIEAAGGFVDREWLASGDGTAGMAEAADGCCVIESETADGSRVSLHSLRAPAHAEERAVEAAGPWDGRHAVIYGMGCGYHVAAIADRVRHGSVTVLESNPAVARAALSLPGHAGPGACGNAVYLIGPADRTVPLALKRISAIEQRLAGDGDGARAAAKMFAHRPSLMVLPPRETGIRALMTFLMEGCLLRGVAEEPEILAGFDAARAGRLRGAPLSDAQLALYFRESMVSDERFDFFGAAYEPAEPPGDAKSILLVCLSSIGDVVIATPAITGLREKFPDARIGFLTETPSHSLFEESPLLSRVHSYSPRGLGALPPREAIAEAHRRYTALIAELKAGKYDAVINLHTSARSVLIIAGLDIPHERITGFCTDRHGFPVLRGNIWARGRQLRLNPAGLVQEESNLKIAGLWPARRETHIHIRKPRHGPAHGRPLLVGINPMVSRENRFWGIDNFLELCRTLVARGDTRLRIFAGVAGHEIEFAEFLCREIGKDAAPHIGGPLDEAAAAAAECALFITADTGPMHFSAAAGARCLAVCGPTFTMPYSARGHVLACADIPCAGCGPFHPCDDRKCFELLKPAHVAAVAAAMLSGPPEEYLRALAGAPDEPLPLRLVTSGIRETTVPQRPLRLRDSMPPAQRVADEIISTAAFNAVSEMENSRSRGSKIDPAAAAREIADRYFFINPEPSAIEECAASAAAAAFSPGPAFHRLFEAAGMKERATAVAGECIRFAREAAAEAAMIFGRKT